MEILCRRDGCVVFLKHTPEPRIDVLQMDISQTPTSEDLETILTIMVTYMKHSEQRFVVHARHVSSHVSALDLPAILTIVGALVESREVVDTRLKGTIVQGDIDEFAIAAKDLFLSMYKPRNPFDIVQTDEQVQTFLTPLFEHECRKRLRKNDGRENTTSL